MVITITNGYMIIIIVFVCLFVLLVINSKFSSMEKRKFNLFFFLFSISFNVFTVYGIQFVRLRQFYTFHTINLKRKYIKNNNKKV